MTLSTDVYVLDPIDARGDRFNGPEPGYEVRFTNSGHADVVPNDTRTVLFSFDARDRDDTDHIAQLLANEPIQVRWPVTHGQAGKVYADQFLLHLDAHRHATR